MTTIINSIITITINIITIINVFNTIIINIFITGGSCEKAYPRVQRIPVPLSGTEGRLEPKKLLTGELSHDGIIRMLRSDKQRTGPQDGAYMRSILRTLKINRDGFARTIQMK